MMQTSISVAVEQFPVFCYRKSRGKRVSVLLQACPMVYLLVFRTSGSSSTVGALAWLVGTDLYSILDQFPSKLFRMQRMACSHPWWQIAFAIRRWLGWSQGALALLSAVFLTLSNVLVWAWMSQLFLERVSTSCILEHAIGVLFIGVISISISREIAHCEMWMPCIKNTFLARALMLLVWFGFYFIKQVKI